MPVSQHAPAVTYGLLAGYIAFAAAIVALTWSNWWLDAKLAGPAHAVDIVLFTLLVLLTEGYTSPFFTFFMFILLSAAIRWGWRATALTAMLLTLLYLIDGMIVMTSGAQFDLQPFVVRTGHLVILSLILIWFGANQWRARFYLRDEELLARPSLDESPLETGLRAAMNGVRASAGVLVWREQDRERTCRPRHTRRRARRGQGTGLALVHALATTPFLYNLGKNRALKKDAERNLIAFAARDIIAPKAAFDLGAERRTRPPGSVGWGRR